MAKPFEMNKEDFKKRFEELDKKNTKQKTSISLGEGLGQTTGGRQTVSQEKAKFFSNFDEKNLTPFQESLFGGKEAIEKERKAARDLLESEKGSAPQMQQKPQERTAAKEEAKPSSVKKPDLFRVMIRGGDPSKDLFYEKEEEAIKALDALGGKSKGTIAGVRFPAETAEKAGELKRQYINKAQTKPQMPSTAETEEERISRKISEVNPSATPEQKARFLETLSKSRARGRERGGYAEEYNASLAQGKKPTAYEERVMAEEARDRRMEDFLTFRAAKESARERERSFQNRYNYLNKMERMAKRGGQPDVALQAYLAKERLSKGLGSSATNVSARRNLFERQAINEAKREIEARDRLRREKMYKVNTSNPEASSFF